MMRNWFTTPDYVNILNGQFSWPKLYDGYCDMADNNDTLYNFRDFGQYIFKNNLADFYMSGVWPGFDDYAVWGWGSGPRLMPRYDGQLYDITWRYAIDDNLPVVQVATWNDWFEGTIIEPAVEFGSQYLQITSQRASEFKNLTGWQSGDFNVPVWIYKIRDITNDAGVLADMQTASNYIKTGQFSQAKEIVSFWKNFFNIDSVKYWTGAASLTAYQPGDYSHDGKINFMDLVIIGQNWQSGYGIRDLQQICEHWLNE